MKLFIIVLCLLIERFLPHKISYSRFYWFSDYFSALRQKLPLTPPFTKDWFLLISAIFSLLVLPCVLLFIFGTFFFGFISLLLNIAIFYYCLGPGNPFFPERTNCDASHKEAELAGYFIKVNDQLFAVIFWYILTGPIGLLAYRLISLCKDQEATAKLATQIVNLLNWVPARLTVLLCLLVGNFQRGFQFFTQKFLSGPQNNDSLLSSGCLLAARTYDDEQIELPYVENLVEHATIVCLVLLAFFTLVAWL